MQRLYFAGDEPWWDGEVRLVGVGLREGMGRRMVDRPGGGKDWLLVHFHTPAEVWSHGEMVPVDAGSSVLWEPGARHLLGHAGARWCHSWIFGAGRAFGRAFAGMGSWCGRPIPMGPGNYPERYLECVYRECLARRRPSTAVLGALVGLLAEELRRAVAERGVASNPRLSGSRAWIEDQLHRRLQLPDLAGRAGLSVSQFAAEFRREFGLSPMRYLRQQRMRRAMQLLRDRNYRIKEVAAEVGYADALHFSREFHRMTGRSPRDFRAGA